MILESLHITALVYQWEVKTYWFILLVLETTIMCKMKNYTEWTMQCDLSEQALPHQFLQRSSVTWEAALLSHFSPSLKVSKLCHQQDTEKQTGLSPARNQRGFLSFYWFCLCRIEILPFSQHSHQLRVTTRDVPLFQDYLKNISKLFFQLSSFSLMLR